MLLPTNVTVVPPCLPCFSNALSAYLLFHEDGKQFLFLAPCSFISMLHLCLATLLPLLPFLAEAWLQKLNLLLGNLLTVTIIGATSKGVIKMRIRCIAASWLWHYYGYCLSHPSGSVFPMQITGALDAAAGLLVQVL